MSKSIVEMGELKNAMKNKEKGYSNMCSISLINYAMLKLAP